AKAQAKPPTTISAIPSARTQPQRRRNATRGAVSELTRGAGVTVAIGVSPWNGKPVPAGRVLHLRGYGRAPSPGRAARRPIALQFNGPSKVGDTGKTDSELGMCSATLEGARAGIAGPTGHVTGATCAPGLSE